MKRYLFAVLAIIILLSVTGYAQRPTETMWIFPQEEDETQGLRFNAISAPVKLSLDGTRSMSLTPALFGLALDVKLVGTVFPIGLYTSLSVDSETTRDLSIPLYFIVGVYRNLGLGFFYDFWEEGEGRGIQGFNRKTLGFALNYDFSLSNPD